MEPISVLSCVDDIRLLAYRYGQLVAVSPRNLLTFRFDGQNWARTGSVALPDSGAFSPRSLMLDDGYAFVLGDSHAIAISLMDSAIYKDYRGDFTCQAKADNCWVMTASSPDQHTRVSCVDTTTWVESAFTLDMPARTIAQVVCDGVLHLATTTDGLWSLDVSSGDVSSSPEYAGYRCARIAVLEDRLLGIGYDSDQTLRLFSLTKTQAGNPNRVLGQEAAADFAVAGNQILVGGSTCLLQFEADALTRNPSRVDLSAGACSEPDLILLTDVAGDTRVLLKRSSSGRVETCLVNPSTGAVNCVAVTSDIPRVCVADSKLVIASKEGSEIKLRTYVFQEDQ